MSMIGKTPKRQPDDRLSNLIYQGGRKKHYATDDEDGREDSSDGRAGGVTRELESRPPNGMGNGDERHRGEAPAHGPIDRGRAFLARVVECLARRG